MKKLVLTVLAFLGVALVAAVAVYLLFFRLASIASNDMQPTLGRDATVVVSLRATPERGDLLLFEVDGQPMIRRVVGLPGERVSLDGFTVAIDGEPATYEERYRVAEAGREMMVHQETLRGRRHLVIDDPNRRRVNAEPVDTGDGYFVMADHREHSTDSYNFGVVTPAQIRGVVVRVLAEGEVVAPAAK